MMKDDYEDDLRAEFDALRKHDRRNEPHFHQVMRGAELRSRSAVPAPGRSGRWLAVAAVLVVGAALWIGNQWQHGDARPTAFQVPAISAWQSPTAGLLQTPARELIAPDPLLSSVFDGITTTSLQRESD
jgi:hypothetical protein